MTLLGNSVSPPGPPSPPLVPGHAGYPSYDECCQMLALIGLYEAMKTPMPAALAFKVGPWERRLREWGRREVERGNTDKMLAVLRR